MFAGIGGFRSGLKAAGGFECVGYCEINRHEKQDYEALYQTFSFSSSFYEIASFMVLMYVPIC